MDRNRYYLYSSNVRQILAAITEGRGNIEVSVDLNKTVQSLSVNDDHVVFDHNNKLTRDELLSISKRANRIFVLENNALRVLEYRDRSYYKLVPTNGAPTVEIDGIKMHRSKGIDPFEDARLKASEVVRSADRVLDTCGGLGYTAICSVRLGARYVLSVEHNEFIRRLRSENPWSMDLSDQTIDQVSADVSDYISQIESESFEAIIHDPPRFSLAGKLYGKEFYRQLYRVLVKGGKVFHYTGNPYVVRRGNTFLTNTAKRLKSAGFSAVSLREHILGVKATK
jgi:predicted methyltransferase